MLRGLLAAAGLAVLVAASAGAAAAQSRALGIAPVVSGLTAPVYVTAAPGEPGRLYVVEQGGLIKVVEKGKVRPAPFLDVRRSIVSGGEQGLLGLAFAPDYASSRRFVVDYTNRDGDTRIVRYRSNGTRAIPGSATVLLGVDQPYPNHNGGMVTFGPDGKLYVGMGDGGSGGDPQNRAQNPDQLLGKLLRLDAVAGGKPEIVADGLRNPWRFSFDRANGDLWIGDVGQDTMEEVDHVRASWTGLLNFGWNVYEGRNHFSDNPLGPGTLVAPVAQYTHANGCSITGGYVYRGAAIPAAKGRYFFGDYCSGTIWSMKAGSTPRREPFTVSSLVSFGEDGAGELYLVSHNGTIYRLRT